MVNCEPCGYSVWPNIGGLWRGLIVKEEDVKADGFGGRKAEAAKAEPPSKAGPFFMLLMEKLEEPCLYRGGCICISDLLSRICAIPN